MKTISEVPGRLRLHSEDLLGRQALCRHVENQLARHGAVREASASHRTGRLLVVYHPHEAESHVLVSVAKQAVRERKHDLSGAPAPGPRARQAWSEEPVIGDFVRQAALVGLRSMLPTPWNALLPMAAQLIRRPAP